MPTATLLTLEQKELAALGKQVKELQKKSDHLSMMSDRKSEQIAELARTLTARDNSIGELNAELTNEKAKYQRIVALVIEG